MKGIAPRTLPVTRGQEDRPEPRMTIAETVAALARMADEAAKRGTIWQTKLKRSTQ
jgi:hypothetical protein